MKKKRFDDYFSSESAKFVLSVDDLLIQIFLRLPARSLLLYKSVSKRWFSIISTHVHNKNPAIGMYFRHQNLYEYVPFSKKIPKAPSINFDFTENPTNSYILQSVNGLMLCVCEGKNVNIFYVYNPTTNTKTMIKDSWILKSPYMLVFDPTLSRNFKVVYLRLIHSIYKIWIYSSETSVWSIEENDWPEIERNVFNHVNFYKGVYFNGYIHWLSNESRYASLRFHVETRVLSEMPTPPFRSRKRCSYFGESCDHLNYVEVSRNSNIVYELKNDYSMWVVKYKFDLSSVFNSNPLIRYLTIPAYEFYILSLICRKDNDSMLILGTSGKIIKYNIADGSFKTIHEFESRIYDGLKVYPYFESLSRC